MLNLVPWICCNFYSSHFKFVRFRDQHDKSSGDSSPVSIGFITYDTHLHFYSLVRPKIDNDASPTTCLSKPQMNVVADTTEVFVPSVEGFLVPADAALVTNLLSTIPAHFSEGPQTVSASPDPILGPAIQAGLEALKAANRCGKLFVLHSCLPTADAPGKLKHREDRHAVGTDKEKVIAKIFHYGSCLLTLVSACGRVC